MKILQLTKSFPFPPLDGASWAALNMARGLKLAGAVIDLASLDTDKHPADQEAIDALKSLEIYNDVETYKVNIRPNLIAALQNLLSQESFHAARFNHEEVKKGINKLIQTDSYNILIVESIFMMNYLPELDLHEKRPFSVVLRAHNVEHLIWERYSKGLKGLKAWYFSLQSRRLRKYERKVIANAEMILTVSETDQHFINDRLCQTDKLKTIPIGMDALSPRKIEYENRPVIFGFIGSLDWRPNLEGLNWFIEKVWPMTASFEFSSVLMIAGRNSAKSGLRINSDVTLMGEVEDSDNFLSRIDYLIVPLFSGSGTRVKVLQAFRTGTPIIATSIACEGLDIKHGREVIIADNEDAWSSALEEATDIPKRKQLQKAGYKYLKDNHDVRTLGKAVMNLFSG